MKTKLKIMTIALAGLVLSGCQTPQNIQQLNDKNRQLEGQLQAANKQIRQLQASEQTLQGEVTELNRVISVLGTEKSSRVSESSELRGLVRSFAQGQIDDLKRFLLNGNLLDYTGGELVSRTGVDTKPVMLVDFGNPIPTDGSLTGVGAYLSQPGDVRVKVLRPVDDRYVVIWESKLLKFADAGAQRLNFSVSVGVEKGDVIGYYFPEIAGVTFDRGTGKALYSRDELNLGRMVKESSLSGSNEKRSYSLGVYGLLN